MNDEGVPQTSQSVESTMRLVKHNRIDIAVHTLVAGTSAEANEAPRPLVLLHGLGECTPASVPSGIAWPGPVFGMDFAGHGQSTMPVGGGYTSEILVGDVDAVIEHLGTPVTLLGRGLGAYVAMVTAAARPDAVHGVVMADGPGLAGGGVHPGSRALVRPADTVGPPDPYALLELSRDVRPADYARTFAGYAVEGSDLDTPLWVASVVRPAWLEAIVGEPGVGDGSVARGLDLYSAN
ncbi:MAG: alpha/beta fold hydrolase [Microthrixaceae bacterium]